MHPKCQMTPGSSTTILPRTSSSSSKWSNKRNNAEIDSDKHFSTRFANHRRRLRRQDRRAISQSKTWFSSRAARFVPVFPSIVILSPCSNRHANPRHESRERRHVNGSHTTNAPEQSQTAPARHPRRRKTGTRGVMRRIAFRNCLEIKFQTRK